jgi:hypothetical protein
MLSASTAIYHGLKFFLSFNVKRNKNHHPIINSVFVAATSAAYPHLRTVSISDNGSLLELVAAYGKLFFHNRPS